MPGLELVKNLADLDRELTEKVEEARRSADQKIQDAETEAGRLLAEAEVQIRQWEEESRKQSAEENAWLVEATRNRAAEEKERLRSQALPNLERAVKFILAKVLP